MDWGATAGKHGRAVDGLVAEQVLKYVREVFLKFGGLSTVAYGNSARGSAWLVGFIYPNLSLFAICRLPLLGRPLTIYSTVTNYMQRSFEVLASLGPAVVPLP
jgi:hypothetical protein